MTPPSVVAAQRVLRLARRDLAQVGGQAGVDEVPGAGTGHGGLAQVRDVEDADRGRARRCARRSRRRRWRSTRSASPSRRSRPAWRRDRRAGRATVNGADQSWRNRTAMRPPQRGRGMSGCRAVDCRRRLDADRPGAVDRCSPRVARMASVYLVDPAAPSKQTSSSWRPSPPSAACRAGARRRSRSTTALGGGWTGALAGGRGVRPGRTRSAKIPTLGQAGSPWCWPPAWAGARRTAPRRSGAPSAPPSAPSGQAGRGRGR